MAGSSSLHAAIAAHRFGLGEPDLAIVGSDARGWLEAQIGAADAPRGAGLLDTGQALALVAAEREKRQAARNPPPGMTAENVLAGHYREAIVADARSRLATAAATARPFAERLQLFWANHFTVSLLKGATRGLVGAFERDAIRPHIAGAFETLLVAATTHPAMLRYLDNTQSAGPRSRVVQIEARRAERREEGARVTGLNENLAREVLELHTLGAESARRGIYTQADVTAFAAVLTGWRLPRQGDERREAAAAPPPAGDGAAALPASFFPAWHEPGPKTVLGQRYEEGPDALRRVLRDLAVHPATARFIATKLARHFIADDPPGPLVDRLAERYRTSGGQLAELYRELIRHDLAWRAEPAKLKTPEEFVVSSARVLGIGERLFERPEGNVAGAIGVLGQRVLAAPSPAGWSDRAEDWLGPDAVWKRVEWATRVADRAGKQVDARKLAERSFGPLLGAETARQLANAADGPQALALLLLAPEFQRR